MILHFWLFLLGKEFTSPKLCLKCKLYPNIWLDYGHKIGENLIIKILRLVSESDATSSIRLGVKEVPI